MLAQFRNHPPLFVAGEIALSLSLVPLHTDYDSLAVSG